MKDAIGQAVPRKEDLRLITGRGTYVCDLQLPRTKHGVRGVGEGGTLGPAAALAGAVGDALGVAVDRLPITPSGLWELMQQEPTQ